MAKFQIDSFGFANLQSSHYLISFGVILYFTCNSDSDSDSEWLIAYG